jgi:hypothetical protein
MNPNVGNLDRILRIVVGVLLVGYAIFSTNVPYSYFAWLGIIPIGTALFGYCPLYAILGIRTDGRDA